MLIWLEATQRYVSSGGTYLVSRHIDGGDSPSTWVALHANYGTAYRSILRQQHRLQPPLLEVCRDVKCKVVMLNTVIAG